MSYKWHPEEFNKGMRQKLVKNLWRAAFMVERDQKTLCTQMGAVDKGRLRASISSRVDEGKLSATVGSSADLLKNMIIRGETGPDVYYAIYVVSGTSKMAPRDFMTPALVMNYPAIRRLFGAR